MYCIYCGKEISDDSSFCRYCGMPQHENGSVRNPSDYEPVNQTNVRRPYNTLCIIGLVVSVVSLFLNLAGLVGIAGLVVSIIGLVNCRRRNERGTALAIIGIVLGSLSILYGIFALISLVFLFVW